MGYLKDYRLSVFYYLICTLLSIFFSVLSLAMLFPFLQLLFGVNASTASNSSNALMNWVNNYLRQLMEKGDAFTALGLVCVMIVVSIFLKNLFVYLSARILGPMKNEIVNLLRSEMFKKILVLPIGYFTEQRKGDLMSRMTNDINEV